MVVHSAEPCGTKAAIDVKKGKVVEVVPHLARGVRTVGLVEEVLGEAVAATLSKRKRATNVGVPEDGDRAPSGRPCMSDDSPLR